ncbi:citrate synthase [Caballeronia insecticola]|uniref:citrate synthase (unknown stereospecificity) n=1 Tax=Caballeronia insecticola TaxID=758793 RepID=R4X4V2_9BURK|nr:citrate synthase [Caballeronia insecticola]BAN27627.1 putative citrate synthase [Caballeronia insecticola]
MSERDWNDVLTCEEALARLNIKAATLYAYVSRGLIRATPAEDGRKRLYLRRDIERLAARKRGRPPTGAVAESTLRLGDPVLHSAITQVTPHGPRYRNRLAVDLANSGAAFESVVHLLATGVWQSGLAVWSPLATPPDVLRSLSVYEGRVVSGDIGALLGMVPFALAMQGRGTREIADGGAVQAARLMLQSMAGCIGFLGPEQAFCPRADNESIAGQILRAAGAAVTADTLRAINTALVVLADNELAPATFSARVAASTNADIFSCVAAAIGSHIGFSTGTGTEKVETLLLCEPWSELDSRVERVREYGASLFGFNHPLYPGGDPRADLMLQTAEHIAAQRDSAPAARKRARVTLAFLERMRRELDAHPGVSLGLVTLARALGMPDGSATAIWIVSRTAGWVAHVMEQRTQAFLLRPRAKYEMTLSAENSAGA